MKKEMVLGKNTISMADEILVVEDGEIIDRGNRRYLEENCELFKRLIRGVK